MNFKEGEVLYFNKPLKWTSFALVAKVRYHISRKIKVKKIKVGHAGTLDPLATGVMIICTGKATKRIEEFQYHTKEYIATTLQDFIGSIEQIPPVFSACKIDGKRAYDLARAGQDVELKPKTLVIDEIELLSCELPIIKIRVVCSKGTYIRALARDIGEALNSGAHLIGLVRTRVGDVTLDKCMNVENFEAWLEQQEIEIEN